MNNIFKSFAMFLAKFYNALPNWARIAIMVGTSMTLAGMIQQGLIDLASIQHVNGYVRSLLDGLQFFLGIALNLLQQFIREAGTELLAKAKDITTIAQLEQKIESTKEIKDLSK